MKFLNRIAYKINILFHEAGIQFFIMANDIRNESQARYGYYTPINWKALELHNKERVEQIKKRWNQ